MIGLLTLKNKVEVFLQVVEGLKLRAYPDSTGILTIGIGIAKSYLDGSPIKAGDTCTEQQAIDWLDQYLSINVYSFVDEWQEKYGFNDRVYVALCSLMYNVGHERIGPSILNALAKNDLKALGSAFMLYNKVKSASGVYIISLGLTKRRKIEVQYFYPPPAGPVTGDVWIAGAS